jgi:type I restriction enzyme S subunit
MATGGIIKHFGPSHLKKINISVPPILEQQKIVSKLDAIQAYEKLILKYRLLHDELFHSTLYKFTTRDQESSVIPQKTTNNNFAIQQAIGALLNKGFKRGEMAIAKVLYLIQEIYAVPIGIQFSQHNFGPYDATVRKALTSGLTQNNQFFRKSGTADRPYYELGIKGNKILKYQTATQTGQALDVLLPKISSADSASIERLATVCKVIQDNKTIDASVVQQKTNGWKPNKFTDDQINKSLDFIKSQGWDAKLLEKPSP